MELNRDKDRKVLQPPGNREAAANVVRAQVENILSEEDKANEPKNPYLKNYKDSETAQAPSIETYHSAWQDYYQKYYEGYYKHHLEKQAKVQPAKPEVEETKEDKTKRIKLDIKNKMRSGSKKVRRSRHFKPIAIGLSVMLLILLLQYYRVLQANVYAFVSPGAINPQNIVVNPLADQTVSTDPRLIIPKINVDVPVVYDIGNDYNSLMSAMDKGLAHFAIPGASAHPGEKGNTVLSGHSSNGIFDNNDYKFIFVNLDKLEKGDVIYANYKGIRYTYAVSDKMVVEPTEVNKLVQNSEKPILTLVTCTPIGTARYRLLVTADQVSPDPGKAATSTATANQSTEMPGNTPTFFEWLFSLFK